ncbi:hypothetical protein V6N12_064032 [Hibiscus sabdariffa]|uniref:Uncharacterized protein n=1 Tax=Hibiscus sabdariffa TaxID=183260 RepID=A0ABR2ATC2_9ROSI
MVKENIVWKLCDGRRVNFWKDCCLDSDGSLLRRTIGDRIPLYLNALEADMIDGHGQWWWDLFDQVLSCDLLLRITNVKPLLGSPMMPLVGRLVLIMSSPPDQQLWHDKGNLEHRVSILNHNLSMAGMGQRVVAQSYVDLVNSSLSGMVESWNKPPPEAYRVIMEPNAMHGNSTLIPHILEMLSCRWEVRMKHICRSGNALADRRWLSVTNLTVCRLLDPPSWCWDILMEDDAS